MIDIQYSYYTLEPNQGVQGSSRRGALLKVQFENGLIGYADCHPWPEIGDKSIEDQLSALKHRHLTSLMRCSLRFARLDAEARKERLGLLSKSQIPNSHFLIADFLSCSPTMIAKLQKEGYTHLKIKLGHHLSQEIAHLLKLFVHTPFKLRLDFNEKLSVDEFKVFLKAIEPLIPSIDFIEDPTPFNPAVWKSLQQEYPIRLACDRQALAASYWPDSAAIIVIKPAIVPLESFERVCHDKVIVTTYLDHPLGQMAAAYVAAQVDPKQQKVHGLLSHQVYQPNPFSQVLSQNSPLFVSPPGTGFGFDEQLHQIEWRTL